MRQRFATVCFVAATILLGASVAGAFWQSRLQVAVSGGGGAGCSQATTFIARTSGLSGGTTTNLTTLICDWVTNGTITGDLTSGGTACGAYFSGAWLMGLTNATNSGLNLCGNTFTLSPQNSPTYANYGSGAGGYTGNSSNMYINTTLTPSTAGPSATCFHASVWNNTNTADLYTTALGTLDGGGGNTQIYPKNQFDNKMSGRVQTSTLINSTSTISDPRGLLSINRTGLTTEQLWQNATQIGSDTNTAQPRSTLPVFILATNNAGTANEYTSREKMFASYGNCFPGTTEFGNFYNPLHTFLTNEAGISY